MSKVNLEVLCLVNPTYQLDWNEICVIIEMLKEIVSDVVVSREEEVILVGGICDACWYRCISLCLTSVQQSHQSFGGAEALKSLSDASSRDFGRRAH